MYYSLLRYHKGKIRNRGNLKRAARCCNIPDPLNMSKQEITHRLKACKRECIFYQKHGKRFQHKHLERQRQIAKEEEDRDAFNTINAIIQREHQQDFWRKLNYVTGKKKTHSATTIQVEGQSSAIMQCTMQDTGEQSIFSKVHGKRYTLAGETPICNGALFQDFGYTANTPASRAVLNGTYVVPANSDSATKDLFTKIAAIRKLIPENSFSITITPEQWTQYWKVMNEETLSLESDLHFGCYKVGSKSDIILHYHAEQVMVTLAHAIQLEGWS